MSPRLASARKRPLIYFPRRPLQCAPTPIFHQFLFLDDDAAHARRALLMLPGDERSATILCHASPTATARARVGTIARNRAAQVNTLASKASKRPHASTGQDTPPFIKNAAMLHFNDFTSLARHCAPRHDVGRKKRRLREDLRR